MSRLQQIRQSLAKKELEEQVTSNRAARLREKEHGTWELAKKEAGQEMISNVVAKLPEKTDKVAWMVSNHIHVYSDSWKSTVGEYHSATVTECNLKIHDSPEEMTIPVQICTRVTDVKAAIAAIAMCHPDDLTFVVRMGCNYAIQKPTDEISKKVIVKGIKSFKPTPRTWPHPTAVIGCGYNGIKTALFYLKDGDSNLVCFDRNDQVGGHRWITVANKTTKLQTDFASFHVWYGPEYSESQKCGGYPMNWELWPNKARVLEHFQLAAQEYGMLPYCHFKSEVLSMSFDKKKLGDDRVYNLDVVDLKLDDTKDIKCSNVYSCPGSTAKERIISYSGETVFGGQVRHGMSDDLPYDQICGSHCAIVGNGGFAIENVGTCCEYGAQKIYLVSRRKQLSCPRIPCWFVHQASTGVPAAMLLGLFATMYEQCGLGDPWMYASVHSNESRTTANIMQASRFAISDVFFLAVAYGRAEIIQDVVKRLSPQTLHLESGINLNRVTILIKAIGFMCDFAVDRLHKMDEVMGMWCAGDFRRPFLVHPRGISASAFATLSIGLGTYTTLLLQKYIIDFPHQLKHLENHQVLMTLPRQKQTEDTPAHMIDAKHTLMTMIMLESYLPVVKERYEELNQGYKPKLFLKLCPLRKFLDLCENEWDEYQEKWREEGYKHEYIPYPYTQDKIQILVDATRSSGAIVRRSEVTKQDRIVANEWWRQNSEQGEKLVLSSSDFIV